MYLRDSYYELRCLLCCSLPPVFHGDPLDYAWGADGLDNAITQASPPTMLLTISDTVVFELQ